MASLRARALSVVLRAGRARARLDRLVADPSATASAQPGRSVRKVARVSRTDVDGCVIWRLDPPRSRTDAPVVLFLHGGAYAVGFSPAHWSLLARFVHHTGASVVAPDYPLAPASTVERTLPWTLARYSDLAAEGRPVVVMGDSAGGGLALSTAVAAREAGLPQPRRLVLLSPWLDVGMTAPDGALLDAGDVMLSRSGLVRAGIQYAGTAGPSDRRASPLFADLAGLPPTLVLAGTADQLVADSRRLEAAGRAVDWPLTVVQAPGMVHDWILFGFLPESRIALADVVEAVLA